jgi:hypothetical protein
MLPASAARSARDAAVVPTTVPAVAVAVDAAVPVVVAVPGL